MGLEVGWLLPGESWEVLEQSVRELDTDWCRMHHESDAAYKPLKSSGLKVVFKPERFQGIFT